MADLSSSLASIQKSMEALNRPIFIPENPALVAAKKQIATMNHLMSGESTVEALKQAVAGLINTAPADHDILIQAFGISITEVQFLKPHTLLLTGHNGQGHRCSVVAHYSQMIAHVVYLPKAGPERVITGFSTVTPASAA